MLCRLMCAESFCCSVGEVVCVLFQATLLVIKELLVCGVCIYMVCMGKGVMHVCVRVCVCVCVCARAMCVCVYVCV